MSLPEPPPGPPDEPLLPGEEPMPPAEGRAAEVPESGRSVLRSVMGTVARGVQNVLDHRAYEGVQSIATYASIFGEAAYNLLMRHVMDQEPDATVTETLRHVCAVIFATNLGLKLTAFGPKHFQNPEAWIDMISIAAETVGSAVIGNARLARMVKGMRGFRQIAKAMRVGKLITLDTSLEDTSVEDIRKNFTWFLLALLAAMPAVADLKNIDYTNPIDALREIGFNVGILVTAKLFNRSVRTVINRTYTQLLEESQRRVEAILAANPELQFLEDELTRIPNEVLLIVKPFLETLIHLKQLINPLGTAMELDEHGEIVTKEIDAVVMVTDLRNYSSLTAHYEGDAFTFFKVTYFSWLQAIIRQHGGHIFDHTGDGLIVYFTDGEPSNGTIVTKEEQAAECAQRVNAVTNMIADILAEHGYGSREKPHCTGIGMGIGKLQVGDLLGGLGKEYVPNDLRPIWSKIGAAVAPELVLSEEHTITSVAAIAQPFIEATRFESLAKEYPGFNSFIPEELYMRLPQQRQRRCTNLGVQALKGIGSRVVYAMPR